MSMRCSHVYHALQVVEAYATMLDLEAALAGVHCTARGAGRGHQASVSRARALLRMLGYALGEQMCVVSVPVLCRASAGGVVGMVGRGPMPTCLRGTCVAGGAGGRSREHALCSTGVLMRG